MPCAAPTQSPLTTIPTISPTDLSTFQSHLATSKRILILCGAGLSASSGLPTFRGAGGYWRTHDATSLATPEAFAADPALVWQFYSYRRHMALAAQPNAAHFALAELSRRWSRGDRSGNGNGEELEKAEKVNRDRDSLCVSQNVDGFHARAGHEAGGLALLHGSLSTVRCSGFECSYVEEGNFVDPIVPALALPEGTVTHISDANVPLEEVRTGDLPHCPRCKRNLLRPGVVWFGEALPTETVGRVERWMGDERGIDLLMVVGTSARVYPAAGYIQAARERGARVAVVNTEEPDSAASMLQEGDWFFRGDAAMIVPKILQSVVGESLRKGWIGHENGAESNV